MSDGASATPDGVPTGHPDGSGSWSPSPGLVGLAWAGAAAAAAWCVLVAERGDRAGLLFAAVAAVVLVAAALFGTRARPRLRVDAAGVTVGGLAGPRHHPWSRVGDVRAVTVRRLGRTTTLLEIDVRETDADQLLVFGRLDLDDDPADVAEAVRAVRAAANP